MNVSLSAKIEVYGMTLNSMSNGINKAIAENKIPANAIIKSVAIYGKNALITVEWTENR